MKLLGSVAMVVLACLALAACSSGEEPISDQPAATVPDRTTMETGVEATEVSPTVIPTPQRAAEAAPTVVAAAPEQERETPYQPEPTLMPTPDDDCHLLSVTDRCATLSVTGISHSQSAAYYGCRMGLLLRYYPSKNAGGLDCLPKGTSLVDVGIVRQDSQGMFWRRVRTVEGTDGWVEDHLVEGPKAAYTGPAPWVDFPDDVALLVRPVELVPKGSGWPLNLVRIYKRYNEYGYGEVVRETIFSHDASQGYGHFGLVAASDASSLVRSVCIEPVCAGFDARPGDPLGRTALYESRDGGMTWEQMAEFDEPWVAGQVLSGEEGNDRLLLHATRFLDDQGWRGPILWPSGETVKPPRSPEGYDWPVDKNRIVLDDGRLAWGFDEERPWPAASERADLYLTAEGEDVTYLVLEQTDSCPKCQLLPDGRGLMLGWDTHYYLDELMGGAAVGVYGEVEGAYASGGHTPWPTIRDPETEEQWPIRFSYEILSLGNVRLLPVAIQHGPFLRVTDVDDCLPIRSEPSPESEALGCMAERVLLTDMDEASEVDGRIWLKVRTPAGIEGWSSSRYLE